MGGVIAAAYAIKYPTQLKTLSLICPPSKCPATCATCIYSYNGMSCRKSSPCRNGSAGPKTAENGCRNGSTVVTKSLSSPDICCCGGSGARSEDMSAEIVYTLNKIVYSLNEITYKSNQSTN